MAHFLPGHLGASRKSSSEAVQAGSMKRSHAPQPRHATAARGSTRNQSGSKQ